MIGKKLNHYEILSQLGKGGMGEVYLAEDSRLKRQVALKILPAEATQQEQLQRFRREAETVAALNHPHIVTIHSIEEDQGVHFLTMERIEGESLEDRIRGTTLTASEVLEILVPITGALAAAHEKGIAHRDLKPANVMITRDQHVKILDFGLAKYVETSPDALGNLELSTQPQLSSEGMVRGTVPYMSPEQAQGKPVDGRSDIFSVGVLLYEMTTGRRPFGGKTSAEIISSILKDTPPPPVDVNQEIPNHLGRIIRRCLEKDPARRYQSAKDLNNDLRDLQREIVVADSTISSVRTGAGRSGHGSRSLWLAVGILIGLSTMVVGGWWLTSRGGHQGGATASIAVLPFVNSSSDPDTDYLGDGLTESLISQLSKLPDLKIMARNTVFQYKDSDRDPLEIGQELEVQAVLLGRVDMRGENLVIGTELIQVSDGSQIWGDRFSRPMDDLLAMEGEISMILADKLKLELTGEEEKALASNADVDPEAYRSYLKGLFHWNRRTPRDMETAVEHFEEAVRVDPEFALAYSGLASTYLVSGSWGWIDPEEARSMGKRWALKALEIDPKVAEAHAALAGIYGEHEWDWNRAEDSFRRALELKPGYATAHQWYGEFLTGMLRHEEALKHMELALDYDPLSLIVHVTAANSYFCSHLDSEAMHLLEKALEMDPDFPPGLWQTWNLKYNLGQTDGFLEAFTKFYRLRGVSQEPLDRDAAAFKKDGFTGLWRSHVSYLESLVEETYISHFTLAVLHARAGNIDKAFRHLEESYSQREPSLVYLRIRGYFEPLYSDPRWELFVARMKFSPVS